LPRWLRFRELEPSHSASRARVFGMEFAIDPSEYTVIPTRAPAPCLSLARALLHAAPKAPPPAQITRLARIHTKAKALQSAWMEANLPGTGEDVRRDDKSLDNSWSIVRDRVDHWVLSADEKYAARASYFMASLFPTGLDFLTFAYTDQWAESDRRIAWIETQQHSLELDDLVDARMMTKLYKAHARYGEALEITSPAPVIPPGASIRECLQALRAELANYARLVIGLVDDDDPNSVALAEAQLAPILKYRKTRPASADVEPIDDEQSEAIEAPLPEPPVQP
jgi:hypothetical protein